MKEIALTERDLQQRRQAEECRFLNKSGQRRFYTDSEYRELKTRIELVGRQK